jgi:ABC-2 type transport system permease protein
MKFRRFAQVAGAVAWRNVHNFVTQKELLFPPLLFPLFFFSAFAGGLSAVENAPGFDYPGGYTVFQFGFVVLQAAAMGGVFAGFSMARDWEIGFGRRLMLAAPQRTALIAGYALAAVVRAVVVIAFIFLIALVTGMDVFARPSYLAAIVLLGMLINLAGSFWASGIALRFRSLQAGPLMQMPVFMILFIAPVYVPQNMLVGWVETAASVNPVTVVVNATRNLLVDSTEEVAAAFGLLMAMAFVLFFWARTGMRRAEAAGG